MKKLLIVVFAVLSFSTAVMAQQNDKFDNEYITMLRKSGAMQVFDQFPTTMSNQMKQTMPNAPEGMLKEISDTVTVFMKEFVTIKLLPFYKQQFTIDEIRDINKFYDTPTGMKLAGLSSRMLEIMPEITKDLQPMQGKIMTITQKWMNK